MADPWDAIPVLSETYTVRAAEQAGATDDDLWAFRRLSQENRPADLDESTYNRYQNLALWLYYQNPLARRLCDAPTDMVLGGGFSVDVEKSKLGDKSAPEVKDFLTRFIEHPRNEFKLRLPGYFTSLASVNGELFLPVFVSPENGDLGIGFLEHNLVREVIFNKDNRMEAQAVIQIPPGPGDKALWWNVIRSEPKQDPDGFPPHPDLPSGERVSVPSDYKYAGEILYFATNKIGSGRGRSALEPCLDWLHAYDNFLFGDLRRANLLSSFLWDVTITGANGPELERKRDELQKNPIRPGDINLHNEKEAWDAKAPNLQAGDHSELGSQVKRVIGLSMGLPSHLIGAEDSVNRTTSSSSDIPFLRRMEARQALLDYMLRTILDYALDQKRHANVLSSQRPYPYRTVLPNLTAAEILGQAEALYNITQAALDLTARGAITMTEARRIIYAYGLMENDVPEGMDEQIKEEISKGILMDPKLIAGTANDPSKGAPGAPQGGGDAKRVQRAKSVPGR